MFRSELCQIEHPLSVAGDFFPISGAERERSHVIAHSGTGNRHRTPMNSAQTIDVRPSEAFGESKKCRFVTYNEM